MRRTVQNRMGQPYRAAVVAGLVLVLLIFLAGLALVLQRGGLGLPPAAEVVPETLTPPPPGQSEGRDRSMTLRLLQADGTTVNLTLEDYLRGVVAAEMPASFHTEALKAQAVAARTYTVRHQGLGKENHPQADVCTDPACCQAYQTWEEAAARWGADAQRYGDKVAQAVTDTDGLICLYNGQPIDAVFFASAAGKTSDAVTVWGNDIPYLVSVESPEGKEVPGWQSTAVFTPAEFAEKIHAIYPQADLSGPVTGWLTGLTTDSAGAVAAVTVGGVALTGPQLRSALGLRSAHFVPTITDDALSFAVTGHGHGVGMSQYGANALADQGKDFREILGWYYTGVTVDYRQ